MITTFSNFYLILTESPGFLWFVPEPAVAVAADLALGVEGLAVAADGVAALLTHVVELRPDRVAVAPDKKGKILHFLPVLGIRDILVRIRASDKWIRIWLRIRNQLWIRLLSSVTLRIQKKKKISYNLPVGTLSSVLIIKFFAKILC
jgi:hypothetical protein